LLRKTTAEKLNVSKQGQCKENAETALRACLERVPFLKILQIKREARIGEFRADLLVKLSLPADEQELVVEVKSNGQPRIAREAVNQLLRYKMAKPEIYGVFIAPYISQRAAEICSKEGIGYIDLAGNCRLSFKQVYIEQGGKPNPFSERRELRSLYSPKASRVLRVLLSRPDKEWRIKELSKETEVSLGQVSNVKRLLEDREWISTRANGFVLTEPEKLLLEWSENYNYRKNRILEYYSLKSMPEIETDLAKVCAQNEVRYALTGFSGAARLAPAVRYQRVTAFVNEGEMDLATSLDFKPVSSGANVILLVPYDKGVFYGTQVVDGVRIASPIQIYLDLMGFRGRGEEAAKVLLEKVIRPKW